MKCPKCNQEFKPSRKAFLASQDTYALSQQLTNIEFQLHVFTHIIPIGAELK